MLSSKHWQPSNCKLLICLRRLQLVLTRAGQWQPCLGLFLVHLCLLASLMPKLQFSFSLGRWLFVCHFECYHFHGPSKVGLILLYLCLSPHFPWLLHLASVVFLGWPRCLFCISFSPVPAKLVSQIMAGEFVVKTAHSIQKIQKWAQASIVVWRAASSNMHSKKAQVVGWQHNQLVRSFFSALPYFILPFPASLERFAALSAAYPPGSLPVRWTGLVSVRSGFLWTCCCNEPHRLDNH